MNRWSVNSRILTESLDHRCPLHGTILKKPKFGTIRTLRSLAYPSPSASVQGTHHDDNMFSKRQNSTKVVQLLQPFRFGHLSSQVLSATTRILLDLKGEYATSKIQARCCYVSVVKFYTGCSRSIALSFLFFFTWHCNVSIRQRTDQFIVYERLHIARGNES